jgi:putative DNA primase/helicase
MEAEYARPAFELNEDDLSFLARYEGDTWRFTPSSKEELLIQFVDRLVQARPKISETEKKFLRRQCSSFYDKHRKQFKRIERLVADERAYGERIRSDLTKEDARDEAVNRIASSHNLITLKDTNEVYYYKDGIYISGGEPLIKAFSDRIMETSSKHDREEILDTLRIRNYHDRDEFDSDPYMLNLKNCWINLRNFRRVNHTPGLLSFVQLPVSYRRKATCPKIMKFLDEVLYPEDVIVIQELFGYVLWKGYPSAKAFMLIGEGSNGKSTLINLIKALLGNQNTSARGLQELEIDRFAKADFHSKLANLYADLPDVALKSTGIFKMLTGGDLISAQRKFQNPFNFVNYAKLIFSANKVPEVHDDTEAFFRRWILITFPDKFEGEKANKNLLSELTTEQELSGLLNWAIEGLKRLQSNGWNFSNSRSTEEIREEYIRKSSPVDAFFFDCMILDPES